MSLYGVFTDIKCLLIDVFYLKQRLYAYGWIINIYTRPGIGKGWTKPKTKSKIQD